MRSAVSIMAGGADVGGDSSFFAFLEVEGSNRLLVKGRNPFSWASSDVGLAGAMGFLTIGDGDLSFLFKLIICWDAM